MATGDAFATPVVPRANPGEEPQEKGLADTLEQLVQMGDWIALGVGALMSLFALYTLKRRVRVEQSLGDRPGLTEEEADLELAWLRHNLEETRSPREAVRLLFELFSRQMAAWGYGRASHETERDYAIAVERALGGKDLKVMDPPVNLVEETRYGGLLPSQAQLESLDRALVDIVLQVGRRLGLKAEGLGGFLKRGSWLPKKLNIVN